MTDDLVGQLRRDRELYGLELWPGYERQSWPERFAELDRQTSARCSTLQNAIIAMSAQHAARIEALEAALRPFALDLKDHVPDDQLIDTVAWTAGEHRAAKAALTPEAPHAD